MAHILVIDDDPSIRNILYDILREDGHEVSLAENGNRGIELINQIPFDLVITDLIMPEKEGVETIIEIRNSSPGLSIIAVSGGGRICSQDYLSLAGKLGADMTMSKPFTPGQIKSAVDELLKK